MIKHVNTNKSYNLFIINKYIIKTTEIKQNELVIDHQKIILATK